MVVCIDIGNTRTSIGLFKSRVKSQESEVKSQKSRVNVPVVRTILNNELFDIRRCLPKVRADAVVIASVVPAKDDVFRRVLKGFYGVGPKFVSYKLIRGAYRGLGADRVANLVGGKELYGLPVCVIDFGTATTIDMLVKKTKDERRKMKVDGEYGGGLILPGVEMGLKALHQNTSLLPEFSFVGMKGEHTGSPLQGKWRPWMKGEVTSPLLGRSTRDCIELGSYWGEVSRIRGLVEEIRELVKPHFVCTGGLGELFARSLGVRYERWLTLWGLYFISKIKNEPRITQI